MGEFTSLEICAGAGGQALGLESAGFQHALVIEIEREYCDILRYNRPQWNVLRQDVREFDGTPYTGRIDLLAGGVPCPPFSIAGKQLGADDERDLFPHILRLTEEIRPKAVMIENVKGLLSPKFAEYRNLILRSLCEIGYSPHIKLLNSSDYGVPQLRPRVVIVGIRSDIEDSFVFPQPFESGQKTVGSVIGDLISQNGWRGYKAWLKKANTISPTIVGGSKKHGSPDLGPTRAKMAWAELGIDGRGIADNPPAEDFEGMPRLTTRMLARIQGFPDEWEFGSRKTAACRMIGNAFPPPVAMAVGLEIIKVLRNGSCN